jgi:thiol-disulfide isomerase/thioredoxin
VIQLMRQQGRLLPRIEELEARVHRTELPLLAPHSAPGLEYLNEGRPALAVGEPAPELQLTDLDDRAVDLADFRGQSTLVLFWNPDCGYCRQMLPALKAWEAEPPPGAPRLLVVSTGSTEANKAMGLRASVVLDHSFTIGREFGASGTPTAVLLDAELAVASELAAGSDAVMGLATRHAKTGADGGSVSLPA